MEVSNCNMTLLETYCATHSRWPLSAEDKPFIMLANVSAKIS